MYIKGFCGADEEYPYKRNSLKEVQKLKEYIHKALPKQFETIIGNIQKVSYPARQGATSEVVFLHTDQGKYVCKRSSLPQYKTWLLEEAKVMKELNTNTSLPIPTFYDYMEDEGNSYLLMSMEEGVPLREALLAVKTNEEQVKLIQSFGEKLKKLHETSLPPEWQHQISWLDIQLKKAAYNLQHYEVDGNPQLLDSLLEHKPRAIPQTLIHGDCTIDNVLVADNSVETFIDLSGVAYGDPRYDVALAIRSFIYDKSLLNAFYKGYTLLRLSKEEFDYFDGGLYEFF